jgi:hypothetical protein
MTNRNKKSRITVAAGLPGMACTRKQASHLLQSLRTDYQLLTPEERNQVKYFILGFCPNDTAVQPPTCEIGSGTLIKQFQKSLMQDEKIDKEEVWSAIRYLDADEREKDKEANTATMIAILAVLLIVGAVWVLLGFRLRQP